MQSYSGRFVVRLSPDLHRGLSRVAREQGQSLNRLCVEYLQRGVQRPQAALWKPVARAVLPSLQKHFAARLLGLVAFGSRVSGEARPDSDLDLLVVVHHDEAIVRSLYHWWDRNIPERIAHMTVNPHFVHLPISTAATSGLWLEVALSHVLLYERGNQLSGFMGTVKEAIQQGEHVRAWSHGHPYWIRRSHAE